MLIEAGKSAGGVMLGAVVVCTFLNLFEPSTGASLCLQPALRAVYSGEVPTPVSLVLTLEREQL